MDASTPDNFILIHKEDSHVAKILVWNFFYIYFLEADKLSVIIISYVVYLAKKFTFGTIDVEFIKFTSLNTHI